MSVRRARSSRIDTRRASRMVSDCDLPHGCLVTLAAVGSDGHAELQAVAEIAMGGWDAMVQRGARG